MSLVPLRFAGAVTRRAVPWQYHVGAWAYNNRKSIYQIGKAGANIAMRGGRKLGGYKRRYKRARGRASKRARFSVTKVGERVGTSSAKKVVQDYDTVALTPNTRVLNIDNITSITKEAGGGEIDRRQRDVANLRGVKFCWEVRNLGTVPLYFNWCILIPKGDDSIGTTDFFRDFGTSRGIAFGTALTSNDFHCRPINSDKYVVVQHKRYRLAPNGNVNYSAGSSNSYMNLDRYVKLKRQFRFDTGFASPQGKNIFVVYWFDQFLSPGGTAPAAGQVNINRRNILYFREPKS